MGTRGRCALPGCNKPVSPSSPGRHGSHLTCGDLHHQLLMAGRFNPFSPNPNLHILDRNAAGFCALRSCHRPPCPGHPWCSRSHYMEWLFDFTSGLQPDQFCKLDGCTRHVFVEEEFTKREFCGKTHRDQYVTLSALRARLQLSSPSPTESLISSSGSAEGNFS
ncbi:hypothetical protein KP509_18G042600 [Ceratopteris richardii]|uniref:Uncharacterized protein n=1 Tax=Ceratopteris richardii TaxID=49495 RepID=A0A8T2STP5_CERRI|nr:hypothetical protein KP509_18G042600 [Ceratopteris richardii]